MKVRMICLLPAALNSDPNKENSCWLEAEAVTPNNLLFRFLLYFCVCDRYFIPVVNSDRVDIYICHFFLLPTHQLLELSVLLLLCYLVNLVYGFHVMAE